MIKNKTFSVYALCDPATGLQYYIGKSTNPKKRYYAHVNINAKKSLKKSWIISLKSKSKQPIMQILESGISKENINSREIFWIAYYKKINPKLKNMTEGGDGGTTHHGRPTEIVCSNGKTYASIKEAALDIGSSESAICLVLSGKNITVKNLQFWKSKDEKPEFRIRKYRSSPIMCSNGMFFSTIKEASIKLSLSQDAISQCLRGLQKQTKGLKFFRAGQ